MAEAAEKPEEAESAETAEEPEEVVTQPAEAPEETAADVQKEEGAGEREPQESSFRLYLRLRKKQKRKRFRKLVRRKGRRLGFLYRRRLRSAGIVAGSAAAAALFLLITCVKPSLKVEAGEPFPELPAYLNGAFDYASFVTKDVPGRVVNEPGTEKVKIHVLFLTETCRVKVVDTTPPAVTAKDVTVPPGSEVKPGDFVESATDLSDITYAFAEEPKTDSDGTYPVKLTAKDASGNETAFTANLHVVSDTTPPVIEGVKDLTVNLGESIAYKKNVRATDDTDGDVKIVVDTSAVDTKKAGTYEVTYTATDAAGNTATETAKVKIVVPDPTANGGEITEDYMNARADELLAKITTAGMSEKDKARAIWKWCHDNIGYYDNTPKVSELDGAYRGIVKHRGDCYTYAMSCKFLLTRAGIQNMDIMTRPGNRRLHYWNLVNFGDGWRHLDATRRYDGSTFFLTPDADLWAYSNSHGDTHNYDPSLYPDIL